MENRTNQILYEINEKAAKYYCSLLLSDHGKTAFFWLKGVGLSEDTIKQFSLGYTGKERCGVVGYLNDLGYRNEQILEAGLADSTERGIEDKFIDRIMIPIKDDEYRVIGFLGRRIVYGSSIYLISPDNSILEKNRNLFGLDHIRESNEQFVILCEVVFDVMVMNQAGFGMAASLLGPGFTMEHAKQIKKYTQNVIICFDTDEYGKKEAERVIDILNQADITARNLDLSPYRDTLEYISREGGTAFGTQLQIALTDKDELNGIKKLLEEKYYTVIFTNLENYLNENKDEFYPENDYYSSALYLEFLLKEYEIIRVSYTNILKKNEFEIIIRSEITRFSEYDLGDDISITKLFRIVVYLDEKNDCFEVVYIGLCMEDVII